jgi:hypothetical protein
MQEIKCFEVMGNTDTIVGRGPKKVVARFKTREAAVAYVKSEFYAQWCVQEIKMWERDCRNIIETTIKILDSMDELNEVRKTLLKESALAKLTKEEKEVLGL